MSKMKTNCLLLDADHLADELRGTEGGPSVFGMIAGASIDEDGYFTYHAEGDRKITYTPQQVFRMLGYGDASGYEIVKGRNGDYELLIWNF